MSQSPLSLASPRFSAPSLLAVLVLSAWFGGCDEGAGGGGNPAGQVGGMNSGGLAAVGGASELLGGATSAGGGTAAGGAAAGGATGAGGAGTGGSCAGEVVTTCTQEQERDRTCENGGLTVLDRYYLFNNIWGGDSGGEQCSWVTCQAQGSVGWGTSWSWSGSESAVKAYPAIVYGWHWGQETNACGLPVQISQKLKIQSDWSFQLTENGRNVLNVAYDLWLHTTKYPAYSDNPTDEIMIWLHRSGPPSPIGSQVDSADIGGASWALHRGSVQGSNGGSPSSWNVFSYVRQQNTNNSSLDLQEFLNDLVSRKLVSDSKYLVGIEAGSEIFTGSGQLDTSNYSVHVPQ